MPAWRRCTSALPPQVRADTRRARSGACQESLRTVLHMQHAHGRRRRLVRRLGIGIAITFVAAQFRPAKGKGPVRKARRGAGVQREG
jgi:hypothetical protein